MFNSACVIFQTRAVNKEGSKAGTACVKRTKRRGFFGVLSKKRKSLKFKKSGGSSQSSGPVKKKNRSKPSNSDPFELNAIIGPMEPEEVIAQQQKKSMDGLAQIHSSPKDMDSNIQTAEFADAGVLTDRHTTSPTVPFDQLIQSMEDDNHGVEAQSTSPGVPIEVEETIKLGAALGADLQEHSRLVGEH
ncbi:hypothetical protein M8C21_010508 [Ambrosia artemisiifolia]|uniref:Uncharacterized protein n=1 Tax=Ambrosia artemisiifolia TaxID=4212 RepID=A0AAD5G808_AMBAR|nr:hypothetical protein M8C21_010508 [Ambrosia artemisiifolia]